MDRAELIEAIADAVDEYNDGICSISPTEVAKTVLRAIEEAGFVLVRKEEGK